ncbi:hypothetical protein ACFWY9_32005 [Amycolatopsis sp. NPDC059027]
MTAQLDLYEVDPFEEDIELLGTPVPAEEPVAVREYLAEHIVLGYN